MVCVLVRTNAMCWVVQGHLTAGSHMVEDKQCIVLLVVSHDRLVGVVYVMYAKKNEVIRTDVGGVYLFVLH